MEATPKAPVPDNFTQNVMERIALVNPSEAGVQSRWAQMLTVSNIRECSFCFFITGFFYLIMGIVLMAGFKAIGSGMAVTDWIALQPHFTIGAAMWLLALGMLLMMDGRIGIKIAQYGTLFYIFFTVVNGHIDAALSARSSRRCVYHRICGNGRAHGCYACSCRSKSGIEVRNDATKEIMRKRSRTTEALP